ncbi:hypothetical protein ABMB44_15610 [Levilactobacillus brevis]
MSEVFKDVTTNGKVRPWRERKIEKCTQNRKGVSENHAHILLAAFTSFTR